MEASLQLLTHHNLRRLFDELETLYQPVGWEHLTAHFADVLRRLIPGDFSGVSNCYSFRKMSTISASGIRQ
jgi:hypothetical protein